METSVQRRDVNCSEKSRLRCVGWTGGRGDRKAQSGTSVCLRQQCSQEPMERAGRERQRLVPWTLQMQNPQAEVRMAPRFPAWVGGGPVVPFAEMEPPGGGMGQVTEEKPHCTGESDLSLLLRYMWLHNQQLPLFSHHSHRAWHTGYNH